MSALLTEILGINRRLSINSYTLSRQGQSFQCQRIYMRKDICAETYHTAQKEQAMKTEHQRAA